MPSAVEDPSSALDYVIMTAKILFAVSPLLVLGYILMLAFEDEEKEENKRKKKIDFQLDGHAE